MPFNTLNTIAKLPKKIVTVQYIAVGLSPNIIVSSTDGITWIKRQNNFNSI